MHGSLPGLAAGRLGVIMFFSAYRLISFPSLRKTRRYMHPEIKSPPDYDSRIAMRFDRGVLCAHVCTVSTVVCVRCGVWGGTDARARCGGRDPSTYNKF